MAACRGPLHECSTHIGVMQVISASRWKRDMGLYGKGKEGSRQLALALFPQAAELLKCALVATQRAPSYRQTEAATASSLLSYGPMKWAHTSVALEASTSQTRCADGLWFALPAGGRKIMGERRRCCLQPGRQASSCLRRLLRQRRRHWTRRMLEQLAG